MKIIVIGVTLMAIAGASASAMVTSPAEFGEMVADSQLVVHGVVVDVQPYETGGRRTIESRVAVQVMTTLKGEPGALVYFRVPGGQVGRYRRVMAGAPSFQPGEEVVLFLKGHAPVLPMPFGLTQGIFRVARDAAGRAVVTPLVNAGPGPITRGDPTRRPLDLTEFTTLVRRLAGAQP